QLTDAQKKELATLQKEILEKKKEVISKYVEYGVMSKEKGDKIISRLEKRYERLEQNGFVPQWDNHKNKSKK
ncbi:MAG: YckD family protein, partial [Peptococcales bacterium]